MRRDSETQNKLLSIDLKEFESLACRYNNRELSEILKINYHSFIKYMYRHEKITNNILREKAKSLAYTLNKARANKRLNDLRGENEINRKQ